MKLTSPKTRRIKLTPPKSRRISPEFVAKALGAELVEHCFKHGCRRWAVTWEREGEEPPAALCSEHASRPDKAGTIDLPTPIPRRS